MRLFDAHCHMQDSRLASDLSGTLKRAADAGVDRMLCAGTSGDDWQQVAALCSRPGTLVPAFGLHPWHVPRRSANWLEVLRSFVASDPRAAVGEIGLDHAIKERNDAEQADVFTAQLKLAKELERPACIHCRKAWDVIMRILTGLGGLPSGFLIHSYSGPVEMVAALTDMGAYFSFSGTITRHRNERGHLVTAAVPLDRLLIETDSPDLMPVMDSSAADGAQHLSHTPNEPANIVYVLRKIAELRQMSADDLAGITWNNACRLLLRTEEQVRG